MNKIKLAFIKFRSLGLDEKSTWLRIIAENLSKMELKELMKNL